MFFLPYQWQWFRRFNKQPAMLRLNKKRPGYTRPFKLSNTVFSLSGYPAKHSIITIGTEKSGSNHDNNPVYAR
jgi:hypothetical protein